MVSVRYDTGESPELKKSPHDFQEKLKDFEKWGLFVTPLYQTTWIEPQVRIEISPTENHKSPHRPTYQLPPHEDTEIQHQLEKALQIEFICPTSSTKCFVVLFVPEKDGGWRMYINYHAVNCITRND